MRTVVENRCQKESKGNQRNGGTYRRQHCQRGFVQIHGERVRMGVQKDKVEKKKVVA